MEEVKYKFTAIGRNSTKEVFPQNGNTLSVTWEKEEENAYFRKKLKGKMMFTGDDFHWLYMFESSAYRCDVVQLIIEKNCSEGFSQFFVARLILNNADWDLDQCTASIEAEVEDRYTCYNDNKGKEFNLLAITNPKQVVQLTEGTVEYLTCSGSQADDQWCGTGDQSDGWAILRYYFVNNNPDSGNPLPHDQTFRITYVREVITSSVPLGDPWISIGGDQYVKQPALYGYRSYGGENDFGYEYQVDGSIDNGMKLKDAVQALIDQSCYPMKIKSRFFRWNEDPEVNKNILDPRRSTSGAKLNVTGYTIPDPDPFRKVTDYIRVIPGGELWLQPPGTFGGDDNNGFYDLNKNFVSLAPPVPGASFPVKIADIPENVHYVRYQYYDLNVPGSSLMLYMGTGAIPFEAFNYSNYATGLPSKVDNLVLFQKSDVKRPGGSGNATISMITWEKIIKDLCNMFNLKWDIDEEGNFVLEHISFFQKGVGLNLVGRRDSRLREGMRKYSYDVDKMPRSEIFQMMDDKYTYGDFKGSPIVYDNSCVGQGDKENKDWIVENFMTDVALALNNPASDSQVVSDDGFILMACDETNHILSESSILGGNTLNNTLAWSRLHRDYWRHGRVFSRFTMNTAPTTALSVIPIRKQVPLTVSLCCGEVFDPEAMITTEMGDGIVSEATFDLYKETLSVTLLYTPDEDLFYNEAPVAVNDLVSTFAGLTIDIDVLGNDTDVDGEINPETLTIVFGGASGTSSVVDGKIRYTPNPGYIGDDFIVYNVKDDWNEPSNNATITVTVKAGSPLPIAGDDTFTTGQGVALTVGTVLSNDTGDGSLSAVPETKGTEHGGSIQIYANGSFVYTPPAGYVGSDGFSYTLKDANNNTDPGHVTITVFAKQPVFVKYTESGRRKVNIEQFCPNQDGVGGTNQLVGIQFVVDQVFSFYSNSAGTIPLDVTGYGLTVEMRRTRTGTDPGVFDYGFTPSGTTASYNDVVVENDYTGCQYGGGESSAYSDEYQLLTSLQYTRFGDQPVEPPIEPEDPEEPVDPPVEKTLKDLPSKFGMAVRSGSLTRTAYADILLKHPSVLGAESALKPDKIGNVRGQITNNADAEKIALFAQTHNIDLHFHCANWAKTSQIQAYVKTLALDTSLTVDDWKDILKEAVQTLALYAVSLGAKTMDAVNEAFNESDDIDELGIYRDCIWYQKLGAQFVPLTFQYIHEVAPNLELYLTDYGQEFGGKKMTAYFGLANEMVANGIPIHGLGYQTHVRIGNSRSSINNGLLRGVATGLKVSITEFDMSVRKDQPEGFTLTPELEEIQSQRILETFLDFNAIPEAQKGFFMTWGVYDGESWLEVEGDFPLLFKTNYAPKKAVEYLIDLA